MPTTTESKPKPKGGFFIGVGCPGCGGDLDLESDFFVTTCDHCSSVLRVIMPSTPAAFMMPSLASDAEVKFHIDRHLKEQSLPLTGSGLITKKLYYPYWKVDASVLKLRNQTEVREFYSETDSSIHSKIETERSTVSVSPYALTMAAGPQLEGVPETIGLRAGTVRVVPFSDENLEDNFEVLPLLRPLEIVQQKVKAAVAGLSVINTADFGQNLTKLFNPVYTLIYFPYFIVEGYENSYRRFVVDGLSGRVLKMITPGQQEFGAKPPTTTDGDGQANLGIDGDAPYKTPMEMTFGQLDVDFHRCSNCGDDLPARLSYVYICDNCHQLRLLESPQIDLPAIEAATPGDAEPQHWIPFWRLTLPELMASRFSNLLGGLDKQEHLYVPALKSGNFEAMSRLARRMSTAAGKLDTVTVGVLGEHFLPVRVSLAEAKVVGEMIISRELVDRGHKLPPEPIELEPRAVGLVYVPFHLENYFLVDSALGVVTVERTVLD